jgi:tripartite motif-containing protein 71
MTGNAAPSKRGGGTAMSEKRLSRAVLAFLALVVLLPRPSAAGVLFDPVYSVGGFGIGRESFDRPVDVVEDREENIYVVDQGNNRVQVLDRRGGFLREWGGRGFRPGSFDGPSAIALEKGSGSLYVVDTQNHRVQKFDPNGKLLLSFGRLGSSKGDFNRPTDLTIDRRGNVYVVDAGNDRIQKFDSSGRFLVEWGRFARRRGVELKGPISVAYSDEGFGSIHVLNSQDCLVQKFDTEGNFLKSWPIRQKGEGAACGSPRIRIEPRRYTVYIADTENDRVILFDKEGEPLGNVKEGKSPFKKPAGLFITESFGENLLVADSGNNLIQKLRRVR